MSFTDTKFCFRSLTGKDKLLVTAEMIAGYLHRERPKEIQKLLEDDHFSKATIINIRDCLALQLMLQNFKRAGDVRGLHFSDVMEAQVEEEQEFSEIRVRIL